MSQLYRPPWAKLYYCEVVVDVAGMFSFLLPIKSQTHDRFREAAVGRFQNFVKWKISVCFINTTDIYLAFKILKS